MSYSHGIARARAPRALLAAGVAAAALVVHAAPAQAQTAQAPPAQPGAAPPPGSPAAYPPGAYPAPYPYPYGQPPPGYYAPPPGYVPGPKTMDYEEGQPVPQGYHVETKVRKGLVIGGAVTFGAVYLISAAIGATAEGTDRAFGGTGDDYVPMYIPIAGPFITMGTANSQGAGTFGLALLGVGQVGGLAMFILGLAAPSTQLVRNDVSLSVTPVVGKGNFGLGLTGTL